MKGTFIPGIWTHSTAVPVAFDKNSVKVSSAKDKSLEIYSNIILHAITKHIHKKEKKSNYLPRRACIPWGTLRGQVVLTTRHHGFTTIVVRGGKSCLQRGRNINNSLTLSCIKTNNINNKLLYSLSLLAEKAILIHQL